MTEPLHFYVSRRLPDGTSWLFCKWCGYPASGQIPDPIPRCIDGFRKTGDSDKRRKPLKTGIARVLTGRFRGC